MPTITDRSAVEPLLKLGRLNHGTLDVRDLARSRRFYEEVLGMECIQTSPASLMIRKGTDHVYAVVETPTAGEDMKMLNHNGFEVATREDVDAAYEALIKIKDEWNLRRVNRPIQQHGDYTFYFVDFDGNWWEVVSVREGGYIADFEDKANWDLTGRHDFDALAASFPRPISHTHNPETRELLQGGAAGK